MKKNFLWLFLILALGACGSDKKFSPNEDPGMQQANTVSIFESKGSNTNSHACPSKQVGSVNKMVSFKISSFHTLPNASLNPTLGRSTRGLRLVKTNKHRVTITIQNAVHKTHALNSPI